MESTESWKSGELYNLNLDGNSMDRWSFANKNLYGSSFSSGTISNANFANASLSNAKFASADISGTSFENAELKNASFNYSTIKNTSFKNALLRNVSFSSSYIENADFSFADMRGTWDINLDSSTLRNTILKNGEVSGGSIQMNSGDFLTIRPHSVYSVHISNDSDIGGGMLLFKDISLSAKHAEIVSDGAEINISDAYIEIFFDATETSFIGEYSLINAINGGAINSENFSESQVSLFLSNGDAFSGDWDIEFSENELLLKVLSASQEDIETAMYLYSAANNAIPEPSTCALILGVLSIALAFLKRSK